MARCARCGRPRPPRSRQAGAPTRSQLEEVIDLLFERLERRLQREGIDPGEMIGRQHMPDLVTVTVESHDVPIGLRFEDTTSKGGTCHQFEGGSDTTYAIDLTLPSFYTPHKLLEAPESTDIQAGLLPILAHETQHVEQKLEGFDADDQKRPRTRDERIEYVNAPAEVDGHPATLSEQLWTEMQRRGMTDHAPVSTETLERWLFEADTEWEALSELLTPSNQQTVLDETRGIINRRLRGQESQQIDIHRPDRDPNDHLPDVIDRITEQLWEQIQERQDMGLFDVETLDPYQGEGMNLEDLFILMESDWDRIKDHLTDANRQRVITEVRERLNERL